MSNPACERCLKPWTVAWRLMGKNYCIDCVTELAKRQLAEDGRATWNGAEGGLRTGGLMAPLSGPSGLPVPPPRVVRRGLE